MAFCISRLPFGSRGLPAAQDAAQRSEGTFQSSGKRPVFLKYRSSKAFILTTACFAAFTDVFLYGLLVPVLPFSLTARAGVAQHDVQHWVSVLLAVYGAALCIASPICGWLTDQGKSRRLPFLLGLLVLAGATVMLMLGRSVGILVTGRILQGLSASVVWVVGLTLVADTVGEADAGAAMGYVSLAYTSGILIAPLLGGVVYAKAGYYAVFGVAFAVIGIDVMLRVTLIEKVAAAKWAEPRNVPLQVVASQKRNDELAIQAHEPGLNAVGEASNSSPATDQVTRKKTRLPPILLLLKSRRMLAAFWGTLTAGVLISSFDTTLPLFVHRTFGWDSTGGGLIFLAVIIPSFSGPIVGRVCDKYGPRWLAASGFLLALPFFVLLRLVTHDTIRQVVLLCALLALIGVAIALAIPPVMAEFIYIVDKKERQQPGLFGAAGAYAQAYGIFNTAWAAGFLIGPVWAGFVESKAGWPTMTWSLGAFSAVSALPILLYTGGLITKRKTDS